MRRAWGSHGLLLGTRLVSPSDAAGAELQRTQRTQRRRFSSKVQLTGRICGDAKVPSSLLDRFKALSSTRTGATGVPRPVADVTIRAGEVDEEDDESTDVALDCSSSTSPPKEAAAAAAVGGGGSGASHDDGLVCGGGSAMRRLRAQESGPRRRGERRPQATGAIGVRQARQGRQHLLSLLDAVHAILTGARRPSSSSSSSSSSRRGRFIYTCRLDVAPDSLDPLLAHLTHLVPRNWQRRGTHVTLVYDLFDGLRRRAVRRARCLQPEGACHSLRATHVGWTERVVSLRVEHVAEECGSGDVAAEPPVRADGAPLHLTLAIEPRHGKAVYSNLITQWTPLPEGLSGLRLRGVVAHERIRKRVPRHAWRRARRRPARVREFVVLQKRYPPKRRRRCGSSSSSGGSGASGGDEQQQTQMTIEEKKEID